MLSSALVEALLLVLALAAWGWILLSCTLACGVGLPGRVSCACPKRGGWRRL